MSKVVHSFPADLPLTPEKAQLVCGLVKNIYQYRVCLYPLHVLHPKPQQGQRSQCGFGTKRPMQGRRATGRQQGGTGRNDHSQSCRGSPIPHNCNHASARKRFQQQHRPKEIVPKSWKSTHEVIVAHTAVPNAIRFNIPSGPRPPRVLDRLHVLVLALAVALVAMFCSQQGPQPCRLPRAPASIPPPPKLKFLNGRYSATTQTTLDTLTVPVA